MLGEEGLIGESLFRSQETQVLSGNVGCREGSAVVSVLENNTDPMSGLRQLCDNACRIVSTLSSKQQLGVKSTISYLSPKKKGSLPTPEVSPDCRTITESPGL